MKMNKSHSDMPMAGFTLIELLVVIVIVGILGSILATSWLGYLNRQRVSAVRTELKAVLQNAQSQAQQKSTSYSVVFGATANGPTAALSTAGSMAAPVSLGSNTKTIQLSAAIGSTAATATDRITFDYRGSVSEDSIPFVVKITSDANAATQKCLVVDSLLGGITESEGTVCDNPSLGF